MKKIEGSTKNQLANIDNFKMIITNSQVGSGSADYSPEKVINFFKYFNK